VIHDVIHNRTVNVSGKPGHNIPLDRMCEHLNASFKGISSCINPGIVVFFNRFQYLLLNTGQLVFCSMSSIAHKLGFL